MYDYDYDLKYRMILPKGYRDWKENTIEGYFLDTTDDPSRWTGENIICYIWNFHITGDTYGYQFDSPTEERLNQWWSEGVRKFVMRNWNGEKFKFYAEFAHRSQRPHW